jgi:hypothetical protein
MPRSTLKTCPRRPAGVCSPRAPSAGAPRCPVPIRERPCDGYGSEGVSWEVGLACVELSTLAGAYDLVGVGDRRRPVEVLAECVAHEGARCRVMTAYACVDVPDELPALGDGDASL